MNMTTKYWDELTDKEFKKKMLNKKTRIKLLEKIASDFVNCVFPKPEHKEMLANQILKNSL